MKFKIHFKKIILILIVFILIFLIYSLYNYFKPVNIIYHQGQKYEFRDDVKEAYKITVYPNETWLHDLFWDVRIENITILFKPMDSKTNGYYRVEVFELVHKLTNMYKTIPYFFGRTSSGVQPVFLTKNFNAQEIENYENINREDNVLKIVLVPPGLTNDTYVWTGGNKIFIRGKNFKDFDLATIKTILAAMGYKPEKKFDLLG